MGLLNSALQIGRSAILSYQGALQVTGNNISSSGSPDYTRLTPGLDSLQGPFLGRELRPGAGVALTSIQRNIDEALEGRIRLAVGDQESLNVQQSSLARVESFFDNISGTDLSSSLAKFFNAFDNLQNTPEDSALRDLTLADASGLAEALKTLRRQFADLGADVDARIPTLVDNANDLAGKIANLNTEITTAEAGGNGQATGLRDQRDGMLRELAQLVDVSVRQQPDGAINVYIGSETLVQGSQHRTLSTETSSDGEFTRSAVQFSDTNGKVELGGGQLAGLITSRDQHLFGQTAAIDELARGIIAAVNQLHADGQGLEGFTSVTGTNEVLASDAPLNSSAAGLSFPPRSGSFFVTVLDDPTSTPTAYRIDVTLDDPATAMSLTDLADAISTEVQGVTATVTSDNRLQFDADPGLTFVFGYDGQEARPDTSGILTGLGINTLFTGDSARNIAINDVLSARPLMLSSASSFLAGDGTIARAIASLGSTPTDQFNGNTIMEAYNAIANSVAVTAGSVNDRNEVATTVFESLQAQRESISGVNLDEEAISLVKYQRAFQGASRFVSAVNDMLDELIQLIR